MIIVSDTSPIRYLVLVQAVDVLPSLFGEVLIPPAVRDELRHARVPIEVRDWAANAPNWLVVRSPTRVDEALDVDPGEAEAISLGLELGADLLLIDDRKGRNAANARGLATAGTLAVLELAAERGLIQLQSVVDRLRTTNSRISE